MAGIYWMKDDYKRAKKERDDANGKIKKIEKIRKDTLDDSSAIGAINQRLGYVKDDLLKVIRSGSVRSRLAQKLPLLEEPYQDCDPLLSQARNALDSECSYLKRKRDNAEDEMERIKNEE